MSQAMTRIIEKTLGHEGGYVNDPRDSGGETNWGITVAVARQAGFTAPMRSMTKAQAIDIYKRLYWDTQNLGTIVSIDERLAGKLFDIGVNMGVKRAGEFLQRLLNALNNGGAHYPDISVDGQIGGGTIRALAAYMQRRGAVGASVLVKGLNALQGAFYIELAERRSKDEAFLFGWLRNRVE